MDKVIAFVLMAVFVIGIVLGIWWGFWSLWCWTLPQVWPTGPAGLISPSYWLFVGVLVLVSFIGRQIFGRSKE